MFRSEDLTKEQLLERIANTFTRFDGWQNIFTGAGMQNRDPKLGSSFQRSNRLGWDELTNLYTQDGVSKKVIDRIVSDMVREWFKVSNDTEDLISSGLRDIQAKRNFQEALTWQDVYGGSIIVVGLDDGQEQVEPLKEENLRSINFLRVYDCHQIHLSTTDLYIDIDNPKFGEPEFYNVVTTIEGIEFKVHESRVLRFQGMLLPNSRKQEYNYWGDSRYQAIYPRLQGLGESFANIERIIGEFIIGIFKMANLEDLLRQNQEEVILKRMHILDMSRSILNSYLIDDKESYERVAATVSGIDELLDALEGGMSAVTGIPVSKLFGKSPKGMNAAGAESEQTRDYYDMVSLLQENKMLENAERLVYLLQIAKEGPTKGQIIDDWGISFNPLWQPTEAEQAKTRESNAKADQVYIDTGVLFPDEVAISRFGGNEYGTDITLSEAHLKLIEENEKALSQGGASVLSNNEPDEKDVLEEGDE